MIDDLVVYGAKTSKLLPVLGKLLLAVIIIAAVFFAVTLIQRYRNVRRARKQRRQAPRRRPAPPQGKGQA